MKATTWKRESRPLADALPGFRSIKFGFARVGEWVAECIVADSSAFSSAAFYVQAFALPRFVPAEHLYFDYGFRIGGRWEEVSAELVGAVRASLPRLSKLASLDGLLGAAENADINLYHAELRLCIGVLKEDRQLFESAHKRIVGWTPTLAWEPDVLARCEALACSVVEGGLSQGVAVLEHRRHEIDRLLA